LEVHHKLPIKKETAQNLFHFETVPSAQVVLRTGIEPVSAAPETAVLSIGPSEHFYFYIVNHSKQNIVNLQMI
jgi:hypothetical protein